MARKTSLYVDATGDSILAARVGAPSVIKRHGRRSLIFRELIRRYDDICRSDPPDLTDAEWSALIDVGQTWNGETAMDIEAGGRWARLLVAAKPNESLVGKLLDLRLARQIAIIDYIERYWAAKARHDPLPPLPGRNGTRESLGPRAGSRR